MKNPYWMRFIPIYTTAGSVLQPCALETLIHKKQHYDNGVSALRRRELITGEHKPQENEGTRQMLLYKRDADPGPQQSAPLGLKQGNQWQPTCITCDNATDSDTADSSTNVCPSVIGGLGTQSEASQLRYVEEYFRVKLNWQCLWDNADYHKI